MIDQLPIYVGCFLMGWIPLKWLYYGLESLVPFSLKKASTRMSYFPIFYLVYLTAEFARAYFMMVIVHDWLAFDYDLLFGIAIWLMAVSWPPFVNKKYHTSPWLYLSAFYFLLVSFLYSHYSNYLIWVIFFRCFLLFSLHCFNSYICCFRSYCWWKQFVFVVLFIIGVFYGDSPIV